MTAPAYWEGVRARRSGERLDSSPYPKMSIAGREWRRGWSAEHEEIEMREIRRRRFGRKPKILEHLDEIDALAGRMEAA